MANSTTSPQIPQHVAALLSHLTSRPGVQSTLILSRKDGSIIQTTGLLASPKRPRSETSSPAFSAPDTDDGPTNTSDSAETPLPAPSSSSPSTPSPTNTPGAQIAQKPYQPSQAESLAAHIFSFVTSASNLSLSLSDPFGDYVLPNQTGLQEGLGNGNGTGTGREEGEAELSDREGDDEVRLIRLRTKRHEIVVVPDKKYLLCVVHDAAHSANAGANVSLAARVGGRLLRR